MENSLASSTDGTHEASLKTPGKKVKAKPDKYHAVLLGKMNSVGIAGQRGKVKVGGRLLKPVLEPSSELAFYERVQDPSDPLHAMKPYIPNYFGHKEVEGQKFVIMNDLLVPYKNPGCIDIKIGLPHDPELRATIPRSGVANLLGCYVHGVEATGLVFHNRINNYIGREVTIDVFHKICKQFFNLMGKSLEILERSLSLMELLSLYKGFRFDSASLLIVFDECRESSTPPSLHMIDFERVSQVDSPDPDVAVITSIKHVVYEMRLAWEQMRPPTIYLVRHGERYDYTDIEWAPKAAHPHDSPLSKVGIAQARDVAERLAYTKPHLIVSSPFQRSVMHAEPLAQKIRKKISIEPGLAEFLCKETRTRVPEFTLDAVSLTPWISGKYKPFWPELSLETWEEAANRTSGTTQDLIERCYGKGDLIIFSHRSTLQGVMAHIVPYWEGETKLEYSAIAMFVEDIRERGAWQVQTFNEVNHMEFQRKSPASNPFRHIEGYYEDLSWSNYKSIARASSGPPVESGTVKVIPTRHAFYENQPPPLLQPKPGCVDLPILIQRVIDEDARKAAQKAALKEEKILLKARNASNASNVKVIDGGEPTN
eukprot:TRINITY_DN7224_c0_g1_i9.p1 TRINITY_DN7224_c0_g1~~TRINITY_DN7224_c0_g1_i9.p1  ORF type:complete len:596 (+),score=106.66 TRINITY_DN7224_c0_g1_i9:61-1848(+)